MSKYFISSKYLIKLGFVIFFFPKSYLTEATRFASGKDLQRTRDLTKNWSTCLAHSRP